MKIDTQAESSQSFIHVDFSGVSASRLNAGSLSRSGLLFLSNSTPSFSGRHMLTFGIPPHHFLTFSVSLTHRFLMC